MPESDVVAIRSTNIMMIPIQCSHIHPAIEQAESDMAEAWKAHDAVVNPGTIDPQRKICIDICLSRQTQLCSIALLPPPCPSSGKSCYYMLQLIESVFAVVVRPGH